MQPDEERTQLIKNFPSLWVLGWSRNRTKIKAIGQAVVITISQAWAVSSQPQPRVFWLVCASGRFPHPPARPAHMRRTGSGKRGQLRQRESVRVYASSLKMQAMGVDEVMFSSLPPTNRSCWRTCPLMLKTSAMGSKRTDRKFAAGLTTRFWSTPLPWQNFSFCQNEENTVLLETWVSNSYSYGHDFFRIRWVLLCLKCYFGALNSRWTSNTDTPASQKAGLSACTFKAWRNST